MIERSALPAMLRSASTDIQTMRATAAELLGPDGPQPRFDDLAETARRLRSHLQALITAVEEMARARPAESVPREVALDEARSARTLLTLRPEPGLRGAVQQVRILARKLRALCDQYDMLSGTVAVGAGVSDPQIRTVSWCEAHGGMAEDVERVQLADGARRPEWGTHACSPCRQRLGVAAAPRQPGKVVRTR